MAAALLNEYVKKINLLSDINERAGILKDLAPLVGSIFHLGLELKAKDIRRAAATRARQAEGDGARKEQRRVKQVRNGSSMRSPLKVPLRSPSRRQTAGRSFIAFGVPRGFSAADRAPYIRNSFHPACLTSRRSGQRYGSRTRACGV